MTGFREDRVEDGSSGLEISEKQLLLLGKLEGCVSPGEARGELGQLLG